MPKSKRNKQVELAKTKKRGLEWKKKLFNEIRTAVDSYSSVFIFSVTDMRNAKMKNVRDQWKDSRFFIGKNKIMAMALGRSPSEEYKPNLHKIGQRIKGQRALLFSNRSAEDVLSWFRSYSEGDFARSGHVASEDVKLLEGPLPDFPHNLEPYLRQLGLPTSLVKGVIHLVQDHQVCKDGDVLTPETAKILKLLGYQMAEFHITINCMWSQDGTFIQFTPDVESDTKENKDSSRKAESKLDSEGEEMEVEESFSDSSEAPELVEAEVVKSKEDNSQPDENGTSDVDSGTPKDEAEDVTSIEITEETPITIRKKQKKLSKKDENGTFASTPKDKAQSIISLELSEETPITRGKKPKTFSKKGATPDAANSSQESPVFRQLRNRSIKVNRKRK